MAELCLFPASFHLLGGIASSGRSRRSGPHHRKPEHASGFSLFERLKWLHVHTRKGNAEETAARLTGNFDKSDLLNGTETPTDCIERAISRYRLLVEPKRLFDNSRGYPSLASVHRPSIRTTPPSKRFNAEHAWRV